MHNYRENSYEKEDFYINSNEKLINIKSFCTYDDFDTITHVVINGEEFEWGGEVEKMVNLMKLGSDKKKEVEQFCCSCKTYKGLLPICEWEENKWYLIYYKEPHPTTEGWMQTHTMLRRRRGENIDDEDHDRLYRVDTYLKHDTGIVRTVGPLFEGEL